VRARLKIISILALALIVTQCDPSSFGLFPAFLTHVSHQRNVSDSFPRASGEKFIMYAVPADGWNTEFVYVIQTRPDASRRLVLLNGVLDVVGVYDTPEVGGMHVSFDNFNHLTGIDRLNFPVSLTPALSTTPALAAGEQDDDMIKTGSVYLMIYPTTYGGGYTQLSWRTFTYVSTLTLQSSGASTIDAPGLNLCLEGAGSDNSTTGCLVFRDATTDEGYVYTFSAGAINTTITFNELNPMGRIVPASVRFSMDGYPVAQTHTGRTCRFNWMGSENNGTDETYFNDYLVAYGQNDAMYLFNAGSRQILKTLAWWRGSGY
jgi:hypothetical protein